LKGQQLLWKIDVQLQPSLVTAVLDRASGKTLMDALSAVSKSNCVLGFDLGTGCRAADRASGRATCW